MTHDVFTSCMFIRYTNGIGALSVLFAIPEFTDVFFSCI